MVYGPNQDRSQANFHPAPTLMTSMAPGTHAGVAFPLQLSTQKRAVHVRLDYANASAGAKSEKMSRLWLSMAY
jgi:hypothetical protein